GARGAGCFVRDAYWNAVRRPPSAVRRSWSTVHGPQSTERFLGWAGGSYAAPEGWVVGRVAVLKGGSSLERQGAVRAAAPGGGAGGPEALGRQGVPIGVGAGLVERLGAEAPEAAFVVLHGAGGEDGTVQELLEILGIPYTGSAPLACMRSMDKVLTKHLLLD